MKISNIAFGAALLSCVAASSVLAAGYRDTHWDRNKWNQIGSESFEGGNDREASYVSSGGNNVSALGLRADRDTRCSRVVVFFNNGERVDLTGSDSSFLPGGHFVRFDLPGEHRFFQRLLLKCHGVGSYRVNVAIFSRKDTPRDDYGWDRSNWVQISTESFEGRNDREGAVGGWAGRKALTLGLRANRDTQCRRVIARFGNGETVDLTGRGSRLLPAGRFVRLDLPGGRRNIKQLMLNCHAVDGHRSIVEVYAAK